MSLHAAATALLADWRRAGPYAGAAARGVPRPSRGVPGRLGPRAGGPRHLTASAHRARPAGARVAARAAPQGALLGAARRALRAAATRRWPRLRCARRPRSRASADCGCRRRPVRARSAHWPRRAALRRPPRRAVPGRRARRGRSPPRATSRTRSRGSRWMRCRVRLGERTAELVASALTVGLG